MFVDQPSTQVIRDVCVALGSFLIAARVYCPGFSHNPSTFKTHFAGSTGLMGLIKRTFKPSLSSLSRRRSISFASDAWGMRKETARTLANLIKSRLFISIMLSMGLPIVYNIIIYLTPGKQNRIIMVKLV
jgi:hypothetical protein